MAEIEYKDYSKQRLSDEEFSQILSNCVIPKKIPVSELVFLEVNANVMDIKKQQRLEENIKRDGMLTQWAFVHKLPSGKYEIISGNHRIKSAIKAGETEVWCIACEVTLPEDDKLRIQISHNTIKGEHNVTVLGELVMQFNDVNMARMSGADFDMSNLKISKLDFKSIDASALDLREITFYFTVPEVDKFEKLIADLDSKLTSAKNKVYLVEKAQMEKMVETIIKVKSGANIKSTSVVISFMIDFIHSHREEFLKLYAPKDEATAKTK